MEVVALCPFPVAAVIWSPKQRGWSLTVICKATFRLAPGRLALADEQIPIHRQEQRAEGDAVVTAPSDLVPFKPNTDVLLVGSAYVSGGRHTRSVVAHLKVGPIDKALKVVGDRVRDADGAIGPAATFTSMPLRYDRGLGGAGTDNPVGIPPKGRAGEDGLAVLPNIEPATAADDGVLPAFGPLPDDWPTRREKLGRRAEGWDERSWFREPLDFDMGYFNVAPEEQQLESLSSGERIELENLHPEHRRLVAQLPRMQPQAFIERRGEEPERLSMRCDTLWIDTDRRLVTLTWRGQARLASHREDARCLVAVSDSGRALTWEQVDRLRARHGLAPWRDVAPESFGGALGLEGSQPSAEGHEVRVSLAPGVSEPPGPSSSAPPPSIDDSFLAPGDVLSVRGEELRDVMSDALEDHEPIFLTKLVWSDPAHALEAEPFELITGEEPCSAEDMEALIVEAADKEGPFEPPLVLCEGELVASFDELATLRAARLAVAPFGGSDDRLMVLLDEARALAAGAGDEPGGAAFEEMTGRLREAFAEAHLPVPPDYLEAQMQRILVQGRSYRRRVLWGARWIRFGFVPAGGRVAFPVYLPEAIGDRLPMFGSLFVRMLAELELREDQYESHPLALRLVALARIERLVR